jgi:hypothetical protein
LSTNTITRILVTLIMLAEGVAGTQCATEIQQLAQQQGQLEQQQGQLEQSNRMWEQQQNYLAQKDAQLAKQNALLKVHQMQLRTLLAAAHVPAKDKEAQQHSTFGGAPARRQKRNRRHRRHRQLSQPTRVSLSGGVAGSALVAPPPTVSWRNATAVAVDNSDPAAKDAPGCGASGNSPCLTIRYGVSRAVSGATVTVLGGGAPYLGECGLPATGAHERPLSDKRTAPPIPPGAGFTDHGGPTTSIPGSAGIEVSATSLTVEGVGGPVTIDCEGRGRAFSFNAAPSTATAPVGAGGGPKWRLVGLEVRNGIAPATGGKMDAGNGGALFAEGGTLELDGCTFVDCAAAKLGGAVGTFDTQLNASNSSFVRCSAVAGGGMFLDFAGGSSNQTAVSIDGCTFTGMRCNGSGGGAYVSFGGRITNTRVSVRDSSFSNSTAISGTGQGNAGGLAVLFNGVSKDATTTIDRCNFTDTQCDNGGGGFQFSTSKEAPATNMMLSVRNSRFTNSMAITGDGFGKGGGLSILEEAVTEGSTYEIVNSDFTGCATDGSGGGAQIQGGEGGSPGWTASIRGSRFTNCTAITGDGDGVGGGIKFIFGDADRTTTTIDRCNFTDTQCDSQGGGIQYEILGSANQITVSVRSSRFTNSTAITGSNNGYGGGVLISYDEQSEGVINEIDDCTFTNTHADYMGGGVSIYMGGTAKNDLVSLRGSQFTNSSSSSTPAQIYGGVDSSSGGGVAVEYMDRVESSTATISDTNFTNCSAAYDGGGLYLAYQGTTTATSTVLVDGASCESNSAGDSGGGVAILIPQGSATGVSIVVQRSGFVDNNVAGGVPGGGGLQIWLPQDAPQNLIFAGDPDTSLWVNQSSGAGDGGSDDDDNNDDQYNPYFPYPLPPDLSNPCSGCGTYPNGCGSCPAFTPATRDSPIYPLETIYRRWTNSNTFVIRDSYFVNNTADYQGGAITLRDGGSGTIENTTIEGNHVTSLFGGGVSVQGTVQLKVVDSTVRQNTCSQRGCQLFSSSGAGIDFDGSSVMELGCGADGECNPGFSAPRTGNVTWGGSSAMTCPAGYRLLNTSALDYLVTFESWKLEPPSVFPPDCKLSSSDRAPGAHHRTPFHSNCTIVNKKTNCPCYFSNNPFGGRYSHAYGTATIYPEVLVSTLTYACSACPRNTYNPTPPALGAANTNNTNSIIGVCQVCPYGSNCTGGAMVATRGFWGDDGSSSGGTLGAFRCPADYCCDTEPCGSIDGCVGNRGGALCGECAPGFAQTIGSAACRAVSECGGTDAAWFVPGALLLALLFALYARKSQLGAASDWPLNAVQLAAYFYQMAQLLPVGSSAADSVQAAIAGLFSMQMHSGGGFSCPFPSLTTLQEIELHYAVPAVVGALLAIGYGVESWQHRAKDEKSRLVQGNASLTVMYQISIMKALALAFSTVLITTFQLLHCVDLRPTAGSRVLFRSATQACGAWQVPFYVLAIVLLLPVALSLATAAGANNACTAKFSLPPAVAKKLCAPYREGCGHWEAVQALHRMVVVAVYSFVSSVDSAVAAVLQTVVCMAALAVHLSYRPFAMASANHAQTALLFLLALVAVLNVPQAMLDTNAVAVSEHAGALTKRLRDAEAALLLAPAVVVGAAVLALAWRERRALDQKVAAGCGALAGYPRAVASALTAAVCRREDDEESQLEEPLLRNYMLVSNSRGLRLTQQTPGHDDDDDDG